MVDRVAELYARRPDEVRRIIVASAAGGLAAFADAFRFRKD
jgi:H+/Cl- antiporter ClcA